MYKNIFTATNIYLYNQKFTTNRIHDKNVFRWGRTFIRLFILSSIHIFHMKKKFHFNSTITLE